MSAREPLAGAALRTGQARLAGMLVDRQLAAHPEVEARYGASGRIKCLEDAAYHITYLAEAVEAGTSAPFDEYLAWAKVVLASRGIPQDDLARYLTLLRELLCEEFSSDVAGPALRILDLGLDALPRMPLEVPSFLIESAPLAHVAREYVALLQRGERRLASELILAAVDGGASVRDIYLDVFQRAQRELGRLWQMNRISVAQEHYCSAATQMIMSQLYPRIFSGRKVDATMVATCVAGNLHEIGVRMLADLFEAEGWNTIFLGSNTPTADVLKTVAERGAKLLAVSAALAVHIGAVKFLIERLRSEARFDHVFVLVGGVPFNHSPDLWSEVGADGHARDADEAIALGRRLLAVTP